MDYSKLITKMKQYKYSANICFDLRNEEKLAGFIPNITTTEILAEYLYSIKEKNNDIHSRILYGSYGTGKSHLLTVLCAILGHINVDSSGFDTFIQAINRYDIELAKFIKKYTLEEKPFLVVPIYSDFSEFNKCISYSLKKELDKNNINICFKSYFHEAVSLLKNWKKGEESNKRLTEICEKSGIMIDELQVGLENLEASSEKAFDEIFKRMTFGATFVSEAGNLIDNLELANEAIKGKYRGIVFVFDEFGRYIEDFGESIKVKAVQDLAEYCDHSKYNDYLILVSHKQLSLYTDKLKKELSEEWKKIEGRFKPTSINIKYDQCLSLIPYIIPKTQEWDDFKVKYEESLNDLYNQAWDFKGFLLPPDGGNPFEGGFPLHPITLYALDRLSKKVAQNERTFFTYLASDEDNSLFVQLKAMNDDEFHFIGLDAIYDYFEENIRSFRSNDVYTVYKKFQYALNKLGAIEEKKMEISVLKAMAVINIVSDATVLIADRETLINVIDSNKERINAAIEKLEMLKIIRFMRQYGYYDFLDSSIYDLDSMIDEKIDTINDEMVINTLNEEFSCFVVYPYSYNLAYHMQRIFIPVFVQKSEMNKKNFTRALPKFYDGIIAFVLDKDYFEKDYIEIKGVPERTILLVNLDTEVVKREVKRFISIKYFYAKREELKKNDPTVEKELEIYLKEQIGIVSEIVNNWRLLGNKNIIPLMNGMKLNINSNEELSNVASELMFQTFTDTIIVNNDLINKNVVSGAMKQARNKALAYIMEDEELLKNCTLLSPEHTILRSVLSKNRIYEDETVESLNKFPNGDVAGGSVQRVIRGFLKKCEKAPVNFSTLYYELKQPPFGLRDGYLPILLSYELRSFENVSIYFHGTERDYSVEELLKAFDSPEDYTLYISNWEPEQIWYINNLEDLFNRYINKQSKNRLKELYVAMNRHFASISKGARTTEKYVSYVSKKYRDIMSISYKDYNSFFFDVLPQINRDTQELVIQITNVKRELENVVTLQMADVEHVIRNILKFDDTERVVKWAKDKYENEWAAKKHRSFDYYTNSFLEYIKNMDLNQSDEAFVRDMAQLVSGFEIEYWNDSKIEDFSEEFSKIIQQLEDYQVEKEMNENEIRIVIQYRGEDSKVTQFNKLDLDINSQTMLNKMKSVLDNFGKGISYEERIQVIARLLSEAM